METSPPSNSTGAQASVAARAQRIAWFGGGVACALGALVFLDSAEAKRNNAAVVSPAVVSPAVVTPAVVAPAAVPSLSLGVLRSAATSQGNGPDVIRMPSTASGVSSDSNNRMIAVTGNDITGQSVLYLIDTIDKQIAVYQASGGAPGTQNIKLVGARNISLDLQLDGLNDRTEVDKQPLTFKDLERRFNNKVDNSRTSPSGVPR